MSASVHIPELAGEFVGVKPNTLYGDWRDRVADGRLPRPLPGKRPSWSRAVLEHFFGLGAATTAQAPRRGRPAAPTARTPPSHSGLPLSQGATHPQA